MKSTRGMFFQFLAFLWLAALPGIAVAETVSIDGFDVEFLGSTYDAVADETTYDYTVVGKGDGGQDLQRFTVGLVECPPDEDEDGDDGSLLGLMSYYPSEESAKTELGVAAYYPEDHVHVGMDSATGILGISWDIMLGPGETQDFWVTLREERFEGLNQVGIKTALGGVASDIIGPACDDQDTPLGFCTSTADDRIATGVIPLCEGQSIELAVECSESRCEPGADITYEWLAGIAGQSSRFQVSTDSVYQLHDTLPPGSYVVDLFVCCQVGGECVNPYTDSFNLEVVPGPNRVANLYALRSAASPADVEFSWSFASHSALYRLYSVASKQLIPPRGDNFYATSRCETVDGASIDCSSANAITHPRNLLFYQVVSVCTVDDSFEGPN